MRSIQHSDDLMGYQIVKDHFSLAAMTLFEYKIDGVRTDAAEMIFIFQRCSISKATTRSMEYTSTALDCQFWPL